VRAACAAFAPIYWSTRDTAKTVAQVKQHNAAWRALCRPPPRGEHDLADPRKQPSAARDFARPNTIRLPVS
jgi:hypothetical protein